jgi:hypothetical protein
VKRTLGALLTAALLAGALAACSPTGSPAAEPTNAAAREALAVLRGPAAKATAELRTRDAAFERAGWAQAGFDTALGGAAQADAAFAAASAATKQRVDGAQGLTVSVAPASTRTTVGEGFGAGLMGSFFLTGLGVDALVEGSADGRTGTATQDVGQGATITASVGADGALGLDADVTFVSGGVESRMTASHRFDPCPAADGSVEVTSKLGIAAAAASSSFGVEVDLTTYVQAGPEAELDGTAFEFQLHSQTVDGGSTKSLTYSLDSEGGGEVLDQQGAVDADYARGAVGVGVLVAGLTANLLGTAISKGWQRPGRCVDLQVSASKGPTGLDPDDRVTLTAKPVAKRDGKPAGGTVEAKLSGAKSLDPTGKAKADATFHYTAPHERKGSGTVALTARSNRGVGAASMTLSVGTNCYTTNGVEGDFTYSGTACDIGTPFTVAITAEETAWRLAFTPTSTTGGSFTVSGSIGGAPVDGGGIYTITTTPDGGTIVTTGSVTIHALISFSKDLPLHIPLQPTTC